jgi:hypothetical protein
MQIVTSGKDGSMAQKSTLLDIDAQIEKLRERRRTLIVKSADRFSRAAIKSGLAEMEIDDEEVDRIVEEIAARFRKGDKKGASGTVASPRGQPVGGTGATPEVRHDG